MLGILLGLGGTSYVIASFGSFLDTVLWTASNTLRLSGGAYRRRIADPVAAREGRKPSTMERAGERSGGAANMKAAIYTNYGPPDVVRIADVEKPVPRDDEVLIKVRAASVNPLDWRLMKGKPSILRIFFGLRKPRLGRPGVDVAGEVEAVGRNVAQFKPGDEVLGACRGAFAEYGCTAASKLVMKPGNVSFEQAASANVAGLTALQGLRGGRRRHIRGADCQDVRRRRDRRLQYAEFGSGPINRRR